MTLYLAGGWAVRRSGGGLRAPMGL